LAEFNTNATRNDITQPNRHREARSAAAIHA